MDQQVALGGAHNQQVVVHFATGQHVSIIVINLRSIVVVSQIEELLHWLDGVHLVSVSKKEPLIHRTIAARRRNIRYSLQSLLIGQL
jgi:hypothetical protein